MGTAFDQAGMHQDVGGLDSATRRCMRQRPEPAVQRTRLLHRLCLGTQGRVQCSTDVVEQDVGPAGQLASSAEIGLRCFFRTQMAHHERTQVSVRLAGLQRVGGCGLKARQRLVAVCGWQIVDRTLVKHHQAARLRQGALSAGIGLDITVQVGSGQHHDKGAIRLRGCPSVDRCRRTPGMQRQHHIGRSTVPVLDQRDPIMSAQHLSPPLRGLPVAVVGFAHGGCHDANHRKIHA